MSPVFKTRKIESVDRPNESILGIGYSLLLDTNETRGQYEVMRFHVPAGVGAPPHIHRQEDECILIEQGELQITLGGRDSTAGPGTIVHLPRNVRHGFQNLTRQPASFLCWVMPGRLSGFFAAFKRPWPEGQKLPDPANDEDVSKMMKAAQTYGIEILASSG